MPAGLTSTACRTSCIYLLVFTFLVFSTLRPVPVRGQSEEPPACQKGTVIIYVNGMFNERADAQDSQLFLQFLVPASSLEPDHPELVSFDLAYNQSEVWYQQLSQVAVQKIQNEFASIWNWLGSIEIAPDWFTEAVLDINRNFVNSINDPDLQSHLVKYRSYLDEGNRIVLVSHSQGNFYANLAYAQLQSEFGSNVGIVQVATPASSNFSGGPWTTFFDDLVMAAVRASVGALPPNILTPGIGLPPDGDLLGHNFIKAYMRVGASRTKIISDIVSVGTSLQYPTPTSQTGVITITLTWGSEPDVDLHVFEPGGTHVYYANKNGQNGDLDTDDVTGFGPEHYFVSCDRLVEGDYRIGVNYFAGEGPEVARIDFKAGTEVAQTSRALSTAIGTAGDNSPIIVGVVRVRKNDEGRFVFEILPQ